MNPDKMRRHMARATPDRIVGRFDYIWGDYEQIKYETTRWYEDFRKRMLIKHKNPEGHIIIYDDNMLSYYPGEVVYVLQYRE